MKLLLYCTKAKPYISISNDKQRVYPSCVISDGIKEWHLNGKIVAECDFEVEEIGLHKLPNGVGYDYIYETDTKPLIALELMGCLNLQDLENYLGTEKDNGETCGYAIHIKNLHIFDKPRELKYYFTEKLYNDINKIFTDEIMVDGKWYRPVNKAPQNMMRVWEDLENPRVLISIRPEWLCKILNDEKTIEVRKKVLKEMLK